MVGVFFITGTSGAGKSTLVGFLKKRLDGVAVHDFDEGGVPEGADKQWRMERTKKWLEIGKKNFVSGTSTVVCGVSVPSEIMSFKEIVEGVDLYFGYLHIGEEEIRRRLRERGWPTEEIEANVNWAKVLEEEVVGVGRIVVDGEKSAEEVGGAFVKWIKYALKQ